jgi:hypothetical protein
LLAEDHEPRSFLDDDLPERLRDASGSISPSCCRRMPRSAPIASAARSASSERESRSRPRQPRWRRLLLESHGLLDGNLVEGIDGHLDVREVDAGAVGLHADFDIGVHDALHGDKGFHVCNLSDGVVTFAARGF